MAEAKVACRTPASGMPGVTRIPEWRRDSCRRAVLAGSAGGKAGFAELSRHVRDRQSENELSRLGSAGWNVTIMKRELEVRGEIERIAGRKPQRPHRVAPED